MQYHQHLNRPEAGYPYIKVIKNKDYCNNPGYNFGEAFSNSKEVYPGQLYLPVWPDTV